MKAAFLSASGELGGAERVLLDLLAALRQAEPAWELHLVAGAEGPLPREAERLGVAVHLLTLPAALARLGDAQLAAGRSRLSLLPSLVAAGPTGVLWLRRLHAILRRIGPDVVHTNGFKMHVLGALALPAGARLVWHVHDYVGSRALMSRMLCRLAGRCSAAICISRSVAEDVRAVCGPVPIHVVHNAVDLERFSPDGPALALDDLAGLPAAPEGAVRVGLVATMGVWKGHAVFLRTIAQLEEAARVRGYIVGGAIYSTRGSEVDVGELRRLAEELGIADRVGFTGFVAEPAAAMRALDVVVHASTQPEPFGLVIAEAMACGRAVVASAAGGAAELVRDGVDALAVPPGDVVALAGAISRLAGDAALRARLGEAGREKAVREFDRARLAAQVGRIYRELAEG